ncbi:MoxR family ATPase [Myroides odoratimimus]|uniref:AAA family ATPase n=1 Tax=Myroides odoratimimus TaxID=76832 RepID=UPI0021808F9B|nr:MoxR family ATPase [Myroides odoratimimus]MCS7473884.1 MoxR family ATPase [Myroides odoratimimus]MDM1066548.1 MoxR family ATPase [Myroides odoratimimus]MDM1411580.1 MoxR family ATPase [Myroides odoratimimus]MDM1414573.1 MoxR family ATPase [Myroides odoratimimus]MDM1447191.1 MoxR family ATPase [Myroides odoratimimus]
MENTVTPEENLHFESRLDLSLLQEKIKGIKSEIQKVIVGQDKTIDQIIVSLLANGHILLEGVPGVAKTLSAKLLAQTIDMGFSRIQFTPDLMPSDILGTSIFNMQKSEFEFKKGPIFSNLILIDEINRAPAKTQAALFEVMEERQITIDGHSYKMNEPFIVIATQNPIEQEGTYRLPEAQLDRFLFKINIDYPSLEEEIAIVQREHELLDKKKTTMINKVVTPNEIISFQKLIKEIIVEEKIIEYIAKIVADTRINPLLYLGASPRASIAILNAAKGFAAINNRDFVTPEDVKEAAIPVLKHRIIVSPEREMEGVTANDIINQIIESIDIPR